MYKGALVKALQFTRAAYLKDSNSRGGAHLMAPIYESGLFKGL